MDGTDIATYKKKRKYYELKKIENKINSDKFLKPIFKYNNEYNYIDISLLNLKSASEKLIDLLGKILVSKILTKYNLCYEKYITYAPGKRKNKKYSSNNNNGEKKIVVLIKNKIIKSSIEFKTLIIIIMTLKKAIIMLIFMILPQRNIEMMNHILF